MRIGLITSCTNRKKVNPEPILLARNLPIGSPEEVAGEWAGRLASMKARVPARSLYAGRAFSEAIAASEIGHGGCHVVSAGLGLISIEDEVPSYSLTVSGNVEDNVLGKLATGNEKPSIWWRAITRERPPESPLTRLIQESKDLIFVIALPSTYFELVSEDLGSIALATASKRVRVVGLPALQKALPPSVAPSFVAYDERFEAVGDGTAGTRSDFPQRIARHFIAEIVSKNPSASAIDHGKAVSALLERFSRPVIPNRQRHSDDELKDVIRSMWSESQGKVTNGLRVLRRERRIACEQSRFKRLFWEVAQEKAGE